MADHHVRHFLRVGVLREHVAHELAVAQHGHAVAERLDLVHLVRDDDDGLAVVAHAAQDGEELVRLLRGEHGGRLVEDEDIRAAVERLDDLDRLLLGHGHVIDLLIRVELEAVALADAADARGRGLEIELFIEAERDVLSGGEDVDQLEVLVDHADAVTVGIARGADDDLLAVDEDLSLVGEVNAREHVHERGLAAAVFAEQRKDLAPVNIQPDAVIGDDCAEALGDVAHFDRCDLLVQCGVPPGCSKRRLCAARFKVHSREGLSVTDLPSAITSDISCRSSCPAA